MLYFSFMNPYIIHIFYNLLTFITIFLIFKHKAFIVTHKRIILKVVTIILVYTQFIRYIYPFIVGNFSMQESLPFFICRISVLVLTYYMFFPSKKLHPLLFFWGSTGIFAVIFPNGNIENIAILNETFFIDHYILAVTPFYLMKIEDYRPTFKTVNIASISFGLVLIGFIPFNNMLEADYFYLSNYAVLHPIFPNITSLGFAIIHTVAVYIAFIGYYYISKIHEKYSNNNLIQI